MYKQKQKQWKNVSTLSNIQTNHCLKLGFQKVDKIQEASGYILAPDTARTTSSTA